MVRKGIKKYKKARKKERSRNFLGENRELSVVPSGVANSAIGINSCVIEVMIPSRIFPGSLTVSQLDTIDP